MSAPAAVDGGEPGGNYVQGFTVKRVKAIITEDANVKSISTDACFAVARATELLLETITARSASAVFRDGRATLTYSDVAAAVAQWNSLDFLDDVVPTKVSAATLLARIEDAQHGDQEEAVDAV